MNPRAPRAPRRHPAAGFSIIEAMFALVVTLVGFVAIFSMQSTQMKTSVSARELSAASNIVERVISQLHKESYMWTGAPLPAPHLNQPAGAWHPWGEDPLDHNLQPHRAVSANGSPLRQQRFCVHYWLSPMGGLYEGLMSARVRVLWPRDPMDTAGVQVACGAGGLDRFAQSPARWQSLTAPAVLRRHPL